MTDDWALPDWDCADLPQRAALDARLADMLTQHLDRDPTWSSTVTAIADDLASRDEIRQMLARFCVVVENLAVYTYGREEAVKLFKDNLAQLRRIAMGAES